MKTLVAAIAIGSLAVNCFLAYTLWFGPPKLDPKPTSDSMTVFRTNGGLLEVSTIASEERFDTTLNHTILGVPVGTTIAQIRVPVTYRYHVALAKEWILRSSGDTLIVVTPPVRPSLPVAIDTSRLESFSGGVWSLITGPSTVASLQRSITPALAQKAATAALIDLQRESARKTVSEFVQKWVVQQPRWKGAKTPAVLTFFADEALGKSVRPLFSIPP